MTSDSATIGDRRSAHAQEAFRVERAGEQAIGTVPGTVPRDGTAAWDERLLKLDELR